MGRGKPGFEIKSLLDSITCFFLFFFTEPQSQKTCNLEIESLNHQDMENYEILWNIIQYSLLLIVENQMPYNGRYTSTKYTEAQYYLRYTSGL